jgi:tRNA 2-selenouridine synthase
VAIQRLSINDFLSQSAGQLILDVRSPGEYAHAHMPAALNFPLFTDEERKIVGTAYKQESREQAIKLGLDFFGPKMRPMVERAEALIVSVHGSEGERAPAVVYLYCWRGGMRSAAIAWLLDLYGFKVYTLAGGYKAYRNYVLQTFSRPFPLKIIGGYTGSGKTDVLHRLEKNGSRVIDLEKIASHRGSAFGSYRMPPPPTQEMFENLLAEALVEQSNRKDGDEFIWIEDESQRIGNMNIPPAFWDTMRIAPLVFLEIPFEERLNYLVREYGDCEVENLVGSVERISKRLGGLETKNTLAFLSEGNIRGAFAILLHYYDKRYLKGLNNREALPALLTKIECTAVSPENAELFIKPQTV